MTQTTLKSKIEKPSLHRRAVAEVISSLLLVAITVVGAVILTSFLDESFVSATLSTSGSDSTIKNIKIIKYDARDGGNLMDLTGLNNTSPVDQKLCRNSCVPNSNPLVNGTEFIIIQIENQSVNPIFLHNVWLGNATHSWDISTSGVALDPTGSSINGDFPGDGKFSIFSIQCNASSSCDSKDPTQYIQNEDNQINSGASVNLLIKLDHLNPDIPNGKTLRTQFNIGENQLSEFLIETGGAQ